MRGNGIACTATTQKGKPCGYTAIAGLTVCAQHSDQTFDGQCTANRRGTNERCRRYAIKGATVCGFHGGSAPQVKRAAARRLEQAAASAALERFGRDLHVDVDGHDGLLEVVRRTQVMVRGLGDLVADLEPQFDATTELFGAGEHPTFVSTNVGVAGRNHLGDGAMHIFVDAYGVWLDRHARACKLAIDAGIAERKVRLVEEQADLLVTAVRGMLRELGVLDDPRAPAIMRKYLELAAGETIDVEEL